MEFSKVYKHNGTHILFSPNGKFISMMDKTRLIIRDSTSFQTVATRSNQDFCDRIEWSCDSQYILCAQYKRGCVQVWAVDEAEKSWSATIREGVAGLDYARWAPDGRHILTVAEFQLRISIWSLVERDTCYHIKYPKFSEKGMAFSNDGKFLAVVERKDFKDFIGVYFTETWELVKTFEVSTSDLEDINWSPDDRVILVWDSPLEYKFIIYTPDGRKVAQYSAYEDALGIKSIAWSPSSQFLSIGSFDQSIRVFNNLTWNILSEYKHTSSITDDSRAYVYREVPWNHRDEHAMDEDDDKHNSPQMTSMSALVDSQEPRVGQTKYIISELPHKIKSITPNPDKPNPKLGVGLITWSCDDRFIATRNDNMPNSLWIWDMRKLSLSAVTIQTHPVRVARWDPTKPRLAMSCGNGNFYVWTKQGCSIVPVPSPDFVVRGVRWHPEGTCVLLADKGKFCCCYL